MTVNCHRLNQVIAPVTAAMPDELVLLEQINEASGPWYAVIDLLQALFSIQFMRQTTIFIYSFSSGYVNSLALC